MRTGSGAAQKLFSSQMNNQVWYSSIARVAAIFIAAGLYGIALVAFFKRPKRNIPKLKDEDKKQMPLTYTGPERRIYQRAKLDVVVRYKLVGMKGLMHVFKEGRIKDISEGGLLLVEAQDKFEVDNSLELKFRLPSTDHFILLRGNVVWVREIESDKWYDCGISITHIEPNDRKNIAKYVAEQNINP